MEESCSSEHKHPHVDDGICGKCRKKIKPGHRVTVAYIVKRAGRDPRDLARKGLWLFQEFEMVHIDCHDPFLIKGIKE